MAKSKSRTKNKTKVSSTNNIHAAPNPPALPPLTLSTPRQDSTLWYKILLLIYDFHHQRESASRSRTDQIIDPIYIAAPYFTPEEAARIKSAVVERTGKTLEATIQEALEKRQETSLAAIFPCGPHDMVPVYLECFGVRRGEIEEGWFVERVGREGLGFA